MEHKQEHDTFPKNILEIIFNRNFVCTSAILITVSNRILIGGGGGRFIVVVSTEDLEESSNVSPGLFKPCVNLFSK
jgi:hypothetical protein